jgi:transposase-like protein
LTEKIRDLIINDIESSTEKLGGIDTNGQPKIVEIDESMFFKSKYNRGRHMQGQWYVGGIERGSKQAFLVPVSNRNSDTMLRVISDYVLLDTIIMTDQWKAYETALREMPGITHYTVNHSLNFVNPADRRIHTQGIEGFWSTSKRSIHARHGINKNQHIEYLLQFLWEYKIERFNRFNMFLLLIRINNWIYFFYPVFIFFLKETYIFKGDLY